MPPRGALAGAAARPPVQRARDQFADDRQGLDTVSYRRVVRQAGHGRGAWQCLQKRHRAGDVSGPDAEGQGPKYYILRNLICARVLYTWSG
eukprot:7752508-Lingulodinium_polyedra.AAC.1